MFKTLAEIGKEQGGITQTYVNLLFIDAALVDMERGYVIEQSHGRRKAGRPIRCWLAQYDFTAWKRGETMGKFAAHTNEEAISKAEAMIAKATA